MYCFLQPCSQMAWPARVEGVWCAQQLWFEAAHAQCPAAGTDPRAQISDPICNQSLRNGSLNYSRRILIFRRDPFNRYAINSSESTATLVIKSYFISSLLSQLENSRGRNNTITNYLDKFRPTKLRIKSWFYLEKVVQVLGET